MEAHMQRRRASLGMLLVLLLPLFVPVVHAGLGPLRQTSSSTATVSPLGGGGGITANNVTSVSVPLNHTVVDAGLTLGTVWSEDGSNGTQFSHDVRTGFSVGLHDRTEGLLRGGRLTLASPESTNDVEDFEDPVLTPDGWLAVGSADRSWSTVNLSSASLNASFPASAQDGHRALLLGGANVSLTPKMAGCFVAPQVDGPRVVRNMTVNFHSSADLGPQDARWVEWRSATSPTWAALAPEGGYPHAMNGSFDAGMQPDPTGLSAAWVGDETQGWMRHTLSLDGHVGSSEPWYQIRFCFATTNETASRSGWLLDGLSVHNEGDPGGAWFHGNLSGAYAPDADGWVILDTDLSGLSSPTELVFRANWDMEGGWQDSMTTLLSLDNGTSWTLLSQAPGLPGNGILWQGGWLTQESGGWIDVGYSLPPAVFTSSNASSAQLAFRVITDTNVGYGNAGVDGWEGMAIDDLRAITYGGVGNTTVRMLNNFTSTPVLGQGVNLSQTNSTNEWAWTTALGANGPTWWNASFESGRMVPRGWSISLERGQGWDVGVLPNGTTSGPRAWTSGNKGAGIVLDGDYAAESLAFLTSPSYSLPDNSSARLAFRSWVCTETDWDGGAVQISVDDGATWWFPPYHSHTHHTLSRMNPYSPFYDEGIYDGSIHNGGCPTRSQSFDAETIDVSNLSGQDVRFRYVFFSDTWVEKDGWYIDDAGVEIDVFLNEGTWTSPAFSAPARSMWGLLDGHARLPPGTNLTVDLLHQNGSAVDGWTGLTLPTHVSLLTSEAPVLRLRVNMSTTSSLATPILERLTMGSVAHLDAAHLGPVLPSGLVVGQDGAVSNVATSGTYLPFSAWPSCPHDRATVHVIAQGARLVAPGASVTSVGNASGVETFDVAWNAVRLHSGISMELPPGASMKEVRSEVDCVHSATGLTVGLDTQTHEVFDMASLGHGNVLGAADALAMVLNATDGTLLWDGNSSSSGPVTASNQSLELVWWVEGSSSQSASSIPFDMVFDLGAEGLSASHPANTVTFTHVTNGAGHLHLNGIASCQRHADAPSVDGQRCSTSLRVWSAATLQPHAFTALSPVDDRRLSLDLAIVDAALAERRAGSTASEHPLEVWVATEHGAVDVTLDLSSRVTLHDAFVQVPTRAWTPGTNVTVITEHERTDPRDPLSSVPLIESVTLGFGPSPSSPLGEVTVDRLSEGLARFRQPGGAGIAPLQDTSTVACDARSCRVAWTFTSTWSFDDVVRLHWWTAATDVEGLTTGPVVQAMDVQGNDVENDLEVLSLEVFDDRGRALHDWTKPLWPYEVSANRSMEVRGQLRIEGIAGVHPSAGDASISLELRNGTWMDSVFVSVQDGGWFNGTLVMPQPGILPSGAELTVQARITRFGPYDAPSTTSEQRGTSPVVDLVYDDVAPQLVALDVLDPGGRQPADGHVLPADANVALVLNLRDDQGLDGPAFVWSWLQSRDDANGNGVSEAGEWARVLVPLAEGRTEQSLDLPLIQASDIVPTGADLGLARFVVEAYDVAGHMLPGGGAFEGPFAAELRLEARRPTTVPTSSLVLDADQGRLYPGHLHTFSVEVRDANGLTTLDAVELALLGQDEDACRILYVPRTEETRPDVACFLGAPVVNVQHLGGAAWRLDVTFRLRWDVASTHAGQDHVPALFVRDEGQDLGLGFGRISALTWWTNASVDLRLESATDTSPPYGSYTDGSLFAERGDVVNFAYRAVHSNSNRTAERLPDTVQLDWSVTDGARTDSGSLDVPNDGRPMLRLSLDPTLFVRTSGQLDATLSGWSEGNLSHRVTVHIDENDPRLRVDAVRFLQVDSTSLGEVPLAVTVQDVERPVEQGVEAHWRMLRQGRVLDGSQGSTALFLESMNGQSALHSGTVDLRPDGFNVVEGDVWQVWFTATDASGRGAVGEGSLTEPVTVTMRWIAYQPALASLVAAPYRPSVGDVVNVDFELANGGVLPGSTHVRLVDGEGVTLTEAQVALEPGERQRVLWTVEAWTVGDLGLRLQLGNGTVSDVPVPLADVSAASDAPSGSNVGWTSLGALALILAVASLVTVRMQTGSKPPSKQVVDLGFEAFDEEE
ncbi:MAG: hypothetical protein CBD01_006805 [Euryarchaeota archaeon TMED141]|nr:MAG: hypothetical protein CBD01_006805 [Euryarchaeota archaeon TMED141]